MSTVEHNFSDALATWKDINLTELQKTMDAQGLELVENQKESMVGRKALADKTKEFKKIPEEEKAPAFKTLLKAYQTEIDSLTRRSKTSENAFLSVYKLLAEAPDPYPLLDVAVDQTVKVAEAAILQSELARLREENINLKSKLADVASLETTKIKAEARVEALEEKMEAMIQERVVAKENELNATYDEKMMNYEERERDLQRQVSLARNQLRELQSSTESTQAKLLDRDQRQDQEVEARLADMDLLAADLERANSRVAAIERRNEILRAEIEAVRSGTDTMDRSKALEAQISELETESARLLRALEAQKEATRSVKNSGSKKAEDLMKEINLKNSEIETLRLKLKQYGDYDEIKRELEIMKYVEFSGGEDAVTDDADPVEVHLPNPNADKANQQQGKSLELLLMAKNKRILEELTKFRVLHGELESSLREITENLDRTRVDLEKQQMLNERLETDLLQVHKHHPSSKSNGETTLGTSTSGGGISASTSRDGLAGLGLGTPATDIPRKSSPIPFNTSVDTSILPIVTSQRDRFRQRNAELEEEMRKQFEVTSELRAEVKGLQADNMKLYEKVRYMQSYRTDSAGPSNLTTTSAAPISRGDDMGKYKNMYEASMNPFEAFRGREAARAVQSLNPIERGVFVVTRQVLGNRRARLAFIFYALALHLLVMFTVYACATGSPTPSHLPPVFSFKNGRNRPI